MYCNRAKLEKKKKPLKLPAVGNIYLLKIDVFLIFFFCDPIEWTRTEGYTKNLSERYTDWKPDEKKKNLLTDGVKKKVDKWRMAAAITPFARLYERRQKWEKKPFNRKSQTGKPDVYIFPGGRSPSAMIILSTWTCSKILWKCHPDERRIIKVIRSNIFLNESTPHTSNRFTRYLYWGWETEYKFPHLWEEKI